MLFFNFFSKFFSMLYSLALAISYRAQIQKLTIRYNFLCKIERTPYRRRPSAPFCNRAFVSFFACRWFSFGTFLLPCLTRGRSFRFRFICGILSGSRPAPFRKHSNFRTRRFGYSFFNSFNEFGRSKSLRSPATGLQHCRRVM